MIFRIVSIACLWFLVRGDEEFCSINGKRVLNKVSDKFLSVSIDPVVLLTGVNLSEKSLELCKHISPAFVRLAGPSTSYVNYLDDETLFNKENTTNVQITPSMWFGMNEWLALANMTPVFGINDVETTNGFWNSNSTAPLLELSDKFNLTCYWQLGYDCSNKTDTQYTEDLKLLHRLLSGFPDKRESWKIVASDFSRCHPQDQLANARKTLNSISAWVEAVMWEPETQSNTVLSKRDTIVKLLYPPTGVKFWTTIPRDSRPVSFSSALQWCKQIGDAALVGYKVVFREPRLHELFSVTPVYWLSVIHKTLMGRVVLDAKKPFTNSKSHIYAHCTKNQNQFLRSGAMTIMIVNNETETYTALTRIGSFSKTIEVQSYIVTSPSEDSTDVFVNGLKLEPKLVKDNKIVFPPKHRRANAMKPISLEVPPKSIGFFVFPGARVPACIKNENDLRDIIEEIGEDQQISLSQEFTENQEPLKQRGNFESLTALQKLLKEELESDEVYYEKKKNAKPDYNLLKSRMIKPYDDKLFNNKQFAEARNLLLERVKLKKPKADNFDAKLDNIMEEIAQLKQEIGGEALPTKYRKNKVQEFPTEELEDLLKRRARLRAARKNVVFTSRELDELVSRANKKSGRLYKRGVGNTKWDDFKSKVEEKKQELLSRSPYSKPPGANARFEELRTRFSQQRDDLMDKLTSRFPRMSHSRSKRQIDYKEKWNELKEQLEDKRQELLGGLNYNDILSTLDQHRKKMVAKMEMDALQNKMEEAKDKILGAMSLDEIKSRAEQLHSKLVENLDMSSFKNKIEDVKGTLLKSANLEDLKDKFEDLTSKWKHDNVLGDLFGRRVRRDINMKMLNMKSHDQIAAPRLAPPKVTPFYHLDPKTTEEFMSSSDEFNGDVEEVTTKKPSKKVDIFSLPKSFAKFPAKTKAKSSGLYGKEKEHPCEKEIFGNGLATVTGDDLFGRSTEKKLDDCINYFNEKRLHHNDDFIHSLSDYFKDPRGQQREDGINLSLDDDDFGQFFNRRKREVEVTKEDIEKYKLKLQNNIKELKKVIKEDRKKVVADKLRYEKEKRRNLEQGLKSKRGGDDKVVKAVNPDVEEMKRQTLKRLADITDKLKTRNSKKGATSTEVTTEFSIKSRLGTDDAQQKVSDILGQIEDKRREMQIKADLQEIMVLKKRLARRQKLLDQLTGKLNNDTQTEKPASLQLATVAPSTTDRTLNLQLAATEPTKSGKAVTKPNGVKFGVIGKRRFTTTDKQVIQDFTVKTVDETVGKPITEIPTQGTTIPETTTETVVNLESNTIIPQTTTEYTIEQARENLDNFTDDEEKFLKEFFNTALYKKYEIDENTIDNPKIAIHDDGPSVKDNSEQIDNKSEGPLGNSENEILGSPRDKSLSSSKESSEEKFKHKKWKHHKKQQRTTTVSSKNVIKETTTPNPIQLTTHFIKMQNNGKFTEDKITVHSNKTTLDKKEPSIVKVGQENPITYIPMSNHGLVGELKDLEQKVNAKLASKVENIGKLQDLQKQMIERKIRSLPRFGDYKSRAANLRKWRPSDILSLNSRGNFPSNNINRHFDTYNMKNNHFKNKRSIDLDADSRENEIDKDYTEDKSVYVHKIGTTTDFPTLIINPKNNDKLISFNDKTTKKPRKKTYYTKQHIQKILPKEEERMFTNFFGNLTGLLQSIGKKMENSFKSLFM